MTERVFASVRQRVSQPPGTTEVESSPEIVFTPAQRLVADGLSEALPTGYVFLLRAKSGVGRTTILRKVRALTGGVLVGVQDFLISLALHSPAAIEESFLALMKDALSKHDLVIVDDLHLITGIVDHYNYARANLFMAVLTALLSDAIAKEKKLVFGLDTEEAPATLTDRAYSWKIDQFMPADYETICRTYLGTALAARLDYAKIHRFAPELNAHQLANSSLWLRRDEQLDTERFIDYLSSQKMVSNVDLDEVETVDWNDLKGLDDVIQALEAKIALPFENPAIAAELQLRPKRGVLLAGPPGTGKTTIGRALARRLKGKFFLIDGTVVAGTNNFYSKINEIVEAAKRNAPSVIFIDDADVIFEGEQERGFYRYLLTMLDGLESATAERVCVMMTAMNVAKIPVALLRSGRVELWLETRLPDTEARETIFREKFSKLPHPICSTDIRRLGAASRGLTGADLKAVVEDGKLLFAHDKTRGKSSKPVEEYFLEAISTVRANRRNYGKQASSPLSEKVRIGFAVDEQQ